MSGKKKVDNKNFYIGKGIKSDSFRSSLKGSPNTNLDTYNKETGKFCSRKKYGNDGCVVKDLEVGHFDHNMNDHAHDYEGWNRLDYRDLSRKEQRELSKAKKKRRFWR
jgi:hypothetical protein